MDGWPVDPRHPVNAGVYTNKAFGVPADLKPSQANLTLIMGAPCSGKTTLALSLNCDHIIDLDMIKDELGGSAWDNDIHTTRKAISERNKRLYALHTASQDHTVAFVVTAPETTERKLWIKLLKPNKTIIMPATQAECLTRAKACPFRSQHLPRVTKAINAWFAGGY